jgi:hypothetical protein
MVDVRTDLGIIKAAETGDVRVIANGCGLWVRSGMKRLMHSECRSQRRSRECLGW